MQAEQIASIPEIPEFETFLETEQEKLAQQFTAARVLTVSAALGMLGNLLFFYNRPGLNVFVYVLLFVGAALGLLFYFQRPVFPRHIAFAVPAAICALLLGVRLAPQLVFLNTGVLLGSLFVVMRYASIPQFLGGSWPAAIRDAVQAAVTGWIEGPLTVLTHSAGWLKHVELDSGHRSTLRSVLRGIMLTVPVVLLFGLLLGSADMVFGNLFNAVLSGLTPDNPVDQMLLTAAFTWVCLAAFKLLLFGPLPSKAKPPAQAVPRKKSVLGLTMIEASMVLGSVNVLFVAFVLIQARYLFGGQANINVQGYTYAEYARRGFYELLAVSLMTMGLILALDALTYRKREDERLFRALVGLMVGLTMVILIAAFRRLDLYENAYGFTRIRVMSGVFMLWLAILLVVLLAAVLRHDHQVFWLGCLVIALNFVMTLNLINMDGFIASRNIARFERTGKLDVYYLLSLSDDALPAVITLLDNPRLDAATRENLLFRLGERLYNLDQDREKRGTLGYHVGKARAWHALDEHRAELVSYLQPAWRYDS